MKDEDKLITAIDKLEKAQKKSNSLLWSFLKGMFNSVGWVIGLALLTTLLIYLVPRISDSNFMGKFLKATSEAANKR